MKTRRATRGFTMVELLLALFLSSVVMAAVYFVFISNTEQYYRQEQIVQMQENMRFALEHLKNDLRNAGRLTVVNGTNTNPDPGFCRPQNDMLAIRLFNNEVGGARPDMPEILSQFDNGIRPDRLQLLVDASGATPLVSQRISGRVVTLEQADRQPTRDARAITQAGAGTRFERLFQPGHFLYISSMDERASDLVPIVGVNFDPGGASITLERDPCLPAGQCNGRCTVNPVQLVEYALITDPEQAAKTDLVRRVLNARNLDPIEGSQLVISEYAVNLQVWGTYDARVLAGNQPNVPADPDPTDDIGNWPNAFDEARVLNAHPERVRALNVVLATRTPRADEAFKLAFDADRQPEQRVAADRTWFKLDSSPQTGFARVATLVSQVETPNIYRGIQGVEN